MADLKRFLSPKSIAVCGGGWAENVIGQLQKSNYAGAIWPLNPNRETLGGIPCIASVEDLPGVPDAAFIGVNSAQTVGLVAQLSAMDAGGAICFAAGFRESNPGKQDLQNDLQAKLVEAAGNMPILGPNCYGYLNYLDNVCLWPDQHGGRAVDSGVAIIAQSSNIAINMTMQRRGLAITHLFTLGNQATIGVSALLEELLDNTAVSAIGLYLEGFDDIRKFEQAALRAQQMRKPIVVLKIGRSVKAQQATLTHTASLAGSAAASSALLARLGIVQVNTIEAFLETLKFLDTLGPLPGPQVVSVSCSGGEASLMADLAEGTAIDYRDLSASQKTKLSAVLGDKVELANPLDYHTYIWGDIPVMTDCFSAVMCGDFDLNVFVLDMPRSDVCDPRGHECAIQAIIAAQCASQAPVAVIALLPENLDEETSARFLTAGIVPLHGMQTALTVIDSAILAGRYQQQTLAAEPLLLVPPHVAVGQSTMLDEAEAKSQLAAFGLAVPNMAVSECAQGVLDQAESIGFPLVLKGLGLAHKTEHNAVVLGINNAAELGTALASIPNCPAGYLIEQMVDDDIAELLIGVTVDATGLVLLTIGAGGVYAELLGDTVSLVLPVSQQQIVDGLAQLKISKLLSGYRGQAGIKHESLIRAIEVVAAYAEHNIARLVELDINPLIVGKSGAVAVDALIRLAPIVQD